MKQRFVLFLNILLLLGLLTSCISPSVMRVFDLNDSNAVWRSDDPNIMLDFRESSIVEQKGVATVWYQSTKYTAMIDFGFGGELLFLQYIETDNGIRSHYIFDGQIKFLAEDAFIVTVNHQESISYQDIFDGVYDVVTFYRVDAPDE